MTIHINHTGPVKTIGSDANGLTIDGSPLVTDVYTKSEVTAQIQAIVGAAPEALDTLQEIAAQLANDESAVSALTTTISGKQDSLVSETNIKSINGKSVLGSGSLHVTPLSTSTVSGALLAPNVDTTDQFSITALATNAVIDTPTGTPVSGQKLMIRIKDDGTSRTLTWTTSSGAFRALGVELPSSTVASKTTYVGCIYNTEATYWDVVAVTTEA